MAQADYVTNAVRELITGADAKTSTNPFRAAYADLISRLSPHAVDLEDRADDLNKVFNTLWGYLTAIFDDGTAQKIPGGLRQNDARLSDLASEVGDILQHAVERMAWRVA